MPAAALPAPKQGQARPANPAMDAAALESRDCAVGAAFYAQVIQAGDYASAEKVWKKGLLPDGGMAKQFAAYRMAKLEIGAITQEGAAGSLYCEVPVTLTDAGDPRKAAARGTIILRRVNDVDGATPEQLRWHIEKSEIQ